MRIVAAIFVVALGSLPAVADHHENPLTAYMEAGLGEWEGDWSMGDAAGKMYMESEWAAGKKAANSEWQLKVEGQVVASGTGIAFWNPEEKRIEEVGVDSQGMVMHSYAVEKEKGVWESHVIKMAGGQGMFSADMTFVSDFNKNTFMIVKADGQVLMRVENIRKVDDDDDDDEDDDDDDDDDED